MSTSILPIGEMDVKFTFEMESVAKALGFFRNELADGPYLTHKSKKNIKLQIRSDVLYVNLSDLFESNVMQATLPPTIYGLKLMPSFLTSIVMPSSKFVPVFYTVYGNVRVPSMAAICDWWHRSCGHISLAEAIASHPPANTTITSNTNYQHNTTTYYSNTTL